MMKINTDEAARHGRHNAALEMIFMTKKEKFAIFSAYCYEVENYIGNEYSCFDCGQNELEYAKNSYEELLCNLGLGYAIGIVEKRFRKDHDDLNATEITNQKKRILRMAKKLADMKPSPRR